MATKIVRECGFEQITGLSSAKGLTLVSNADGSVPNAVILSVEAQNVRYRCDGTNPTASVGNRIIKDQQPFLYDGDLKAIKFIEESASAKINAQYVLVEYY